MLGVQKKPLLPLELQLQLERDERNKAEKEQMENELAEQELEDQGILRVKFKQADCAEMEEIDNLDD